MSENLFPYKAKLAKGDEDKYPDLGPHKGARKLSSQEERAFTAWFEMRRDERHPGDYHTAWKQAYKWKQFNNRLRKDISCAIAAIEGTESENPIHTQLIEHAVYILKRAIEK